MPAEGTGSSHSSDSEDSSDSSGERSFQRRVVRTFAEIDSQRTGCISFRQFLSWWKRRRTASEGAISDCELNEAREAFIKSDATGRGGIEVSELGALLTDLDLLDLIESEELDDDEPEPPSPAAEPQALPPQASELAIDTPGQSDAVPAELPGQPEHAGGQQVAPPPLQLSQPGTEDGGPGSPKQSTERSSEAEQPSSVPTIQQPDDENKTNEEKMPDEPKQRDEPDAALLAQLENAQKETQALRAQLKMQQARADAQKVQIEKQTQRQNDTGQIIERARAARLPPCRFRATLAADRAPARHCSSRPNTSGFGTRRTKQPTRSSEQRTTTSSFVTSSVKRSGVCRTQSRTRKSLSTAKTFSASRTGSSLAQIGALPTVPSRPPGRTSCR